AALHVLHLALPSRRSDRFRLWLRLRLRRAGILPFRSCVTIDQLDYRDGSGIAVAEAGLHHPGVAAVAILVARTQHLEELLDHLDIAHLRNRLAARMEIAALGARAQFLDNGPQGLGLRQCAVELFALDHGRGK